MDEEAASAVRNIGNIDKADADADVYVGEQQPAKAKVKIRTVLAKKFKGFLTWIQRISKPQHTKKCYFVEEVEIHMGWEIFKDGEEIFIYPLTQFLCNQYYLVFT